MLSKEDALYGAAWKVLYERLDPDGCVSREKLTSTMTVMAKIASWVETQPSEIRAAYDRAKVDIMKRANDVLENNERATQMADVFAALPKPPAE